MIPWVIESWANYDIALFTDIPDPSELANSEHAIVVMNHRGDLDWMVGWVVINQIGMLGVSEQYMLCHLGNVWYIILFAKTL